MSACNFTIREASTADSEAVAAIYAHHVLHGTASYDVQPPPADQMRQKIAWVLRSNWPFLVAERGDDLLGFAYATQFRDRAAYRWTAEDSIYVHPSATGQGIGKALLNLLLERTERCGFRQMIAVIGGAAEASVRLHLACGFVESGRIRGAGWKHGRWLDSVYMQRSLGEGTTTPPTK